VGGNGYFAPISMLRGPTKITLDAKGRLSIPTKYRERIEARCGGHLICTVDQRSCLLIYPLPDWEETERKLMRLPSLNETAQKLRGLLMGYATDLELDGHNRVLIPKEHREFAGLERQAMMFGQGNKFELWDEGRWNEQLSRWMDSGSADSADLTAELETLSY
jgi:MraZ protein